LGIDLIKLFQVGTLSSFHIAIEFWRTGREDEEAHAFLLASLFELGHELTTPVHLHGFEGEKESLLDFFQERATMANADPVVSLGHIISRAVKCL